MRSQCEYEAGLMDIFGGSGARQPQQSRGMPHYNSERMLIYYITDRRQFGGTEQEKSESVLAKVAEAAHCGVDLIQVREKDLSARQLFEFVRAAGRLVRDAEQSPGRTRLIVNSRTDVALAAGAHGVHLTGDDIKPGDVRAIHGVWLHTRSVRTTGQCGAAGDLLQAFIIAVSCHSAHEVRMAEAHGAGLAVFAPVFEKEVKETDEHGSSRILMSTKRKAGEGLAELREACRAENRPTGPEAIGATRMPVLALGGITLRNARECLDAGAAGVAAIRLFQDNDVAEVTRQLRLLE